MIRSRSEQGFLHARGVCLTVALPNPTGPVQPDGHPPVTAGWICRNPPVAVIRCMCRQFNIYFGLCRIGNDLSRDIRRLRRGGMGLLFTTISAKRRSGRSCLTGIHIEIDFLKPDRYAHGKRFR